MCTVLSKGIIILVDLCGRGKGKIEWILEAHHEALKNQRMV